LHREYEEKDRKYADKYPSNPKSSGHHKKKDSILDVFGDLF
jgi:hypothetical protein